VDLALENVERFALNEAIDQAADGIVITDAGGNITFVNPAFTSMTGYSITEAVGNSPRVLNSGRQPADFYKELWSTIRSGKIWQGRLVNRRKDGSFFNEEMRIAPVRDSHGSISSFIAIKRDITDQIRAKSALEESESRFCRLFESSGAVMLLIDPSSKSIVKANHAAHTYYGYGNGWLSGQPLSLINNDHETETAFVIPGFSVDECQFVSFVHRLASGEKRDVEVYSAPVEVQQKLLAFHIVHDVTERKRAQEGLRRSEQRYRIAFQTSLDAITICHLYNGCYVDVNNAFVQIMGFGREEVIGTSSLELGVWVDYRDRLSLIEIVKAQTNCRDVEVQFKRKNGEVFWAVVAASIVELDGVPCLLMVLRDISNAKVAEREIQRLAFFDALTDLPNRRMLLDLLSKPRSSSTRKWRSRALLFVDIDNFKTLNDTLGHHIGDLLLQKIAARLKGCFREADTVAHQGGDVFVVLLEDLSENPDDARAQAKVVADKLVVTVGQPYHLGSQECRITASIGVTVFGSDLENAQDALQQADIAMHQAKATGRNCVQFFVPELQTAVNARASLEKDLRSAIIEEQFLLYYQPQLDRGVLIGAEALLRWNHPSRGLVAPNEFIPLAEETGIILPLGKWVLETACRLVASWAHHDNTSEFTIAVNISARQFQQPDFVEQVQATMKSTGANPKNLKLELTESMLVNNVDDVIRRMTDLKRLGLRFSVDDFGTGYSSLSYLKRLPLDQLKIDRSFVRDILKDVGSGAIAQSIISLSKAMGFSVIAEGVETEEQRKFLAQLGCHSFQGFLFRGPLPLEEFQSLLHAPGGRIRSSPGHKGSRAGWKPPLQKKARWAAAGRAPVN